MGYHTPGYVNAAEEVLVVSHGKDPLEETFSTTCNIAGLCSEPAPGLSHCLEIVFPLIISFTARLNTFGLPAHCAALSGAARIVHTWIGSVSLHRSDAV